jgi:hypothetical protein
VIAFLALLAVAFVLGKLIHDAFEDERTEGPDR